MGFLGDERFHGGLIAVALVANFFILRAALKHHHNRWPLLLCVAGGTMALLGHVTAPWVEYSGFGLLMAAAILNVVLLRSHRKAGGACCSHEHGENDLSHSVGSARLECCRGSTFAV